MNIDLSVSSVLGTITMFIFVAIFSKAAYDMATGKTPSYNGVLLHGSSQKRRTITRYYTLVALLSAVTAVGLLSSNAVILGIVDLCFAVLCITVVSAFHNPPKSVGVLARTEKAREIERYVSYGLSLMFIILSVVHLWPVLLG